jgi:hypothetical protein
MSSNDRLDQLRLDTSQLVVEESYTDLQVGSIRKLSPVDVDGQPDPTRSVQFIGSSQIMTPAGPMPISFELNGPDLKSAIESFPGAAEKAIEEAVEELKKMQREQQSSIMVPGQGGPGAGGQQGGMPGGGIKL